MALKHQPQRLSEEEYLAGELISEIKHEYIDGDVYAMAGASKNHDKITINLVRHVANHLANTPCTVYSSDMKVKTTGNFFYPDLTVVCDDISDSEYFTESPLIIIEVLSKATRKIDRSLKKLAYQNLPSLKEYVIIEQDIVDVEICRRDNHWQSEHYFLGDEVYFAAIELRLAVEEIYARVDNEDMREFLAARASATETP